MDSWIIEEWKRKFPDQTKGRTDREIALGILAAFPEYSASYPILLKHKREAEIEVDRSKAPVDRHTVRAVQEKDASDRSFGSTYLKDPVRRGVLQSKMAKIVMGSLTPETEFGRDDVAEIARIRKEMQELETSEHFREFQSANGFRESWSEFWGIKETPAIIGEVTVESMAGLLHHGWAKIAGGAAAGAGTGAALGAVGGPVAGVTATGGALWGGAAGMGKTSYNLSAAGKFIEVMEKTVGPEVMSSPNRLYEALNNPDTIKKARSSAVKYGLPVGVFDALSVGLGGRALSGVTKIASGGATTMARRLPATGLLNQAAKQGLLGSAKAAPIVVPFGFQSTMGMGGEATGQLLTDGKIDDWKGVFLEGIAELGMAPFEMTAAHLTRDMSPDYAKALNDRIEVGFKNKVPADGQKMDVDQQVAEQKLTPEQGEEYKRRIDEFYKSMNDTGKRPQNEEGASKPDKDKDSILRAINKANEEEPSKPSPVAPEEEEVGARPSFNLFFAKSKDTLGAYKKADGKGKADLEARDAADGGVDVVDSRDTDEIRKYSGYEMLADQQGVMSAVEDKVREGQLGLLGGIPTSLQDLHKTNEASGGMLGDPKKVDSIIKAIGEETGAADDAYPFSSATASVIEKAGESLSNEQKALLGDFASELDASNIRRVDGGQDWDDAKAQFARKKDTGTMDMFAESEAEAIRSKAAGKEVGPAKLGKAGFIESGDALYEAATMKEFAEGEERKWLKDGEHYVKPDGNVYKAVTDGPDVLVGKIPDEGEMTQPEMEGFKQTKVTPLDREIANRERESRKRVEAAMETDPAEFALEGEDARGIEPSRGGERSSDRTGLYRPFDEGDFPVSEYGLFAVPSVAFGKIWNQRDPKNPKKFEKISYIEGVRRAAARLATNYKFSRGNEAEDWAWASLVGGTPRKTYRGYDPATPERTGESVGEPVEGVLQAIAERVRKHVSEDGRSPTDKAVLYSTKAEVKKRGEPFQFSGKKKLVQNFLDMEKSALRERARIGSGMQRTKTSGKKLSAKERKRQMREKAPVAGGGRKQSGGTSWPVSVGEKMETQSELKERQDIEAARKAVTRKPQVHFDGEEFAEVEEGIEDVDFSRFDELIDTYHGASADMARAPKNVISAEATKLSVRKFIQDFMRMLHAEYPRALHRESWPEFSRDVINDEIYLNVLIPSWQIAKEKQLAKAKDLPKVKEQIESVGDEMARLDNSLRELDGKTLNQIISRINYASSSVRAGTLYTEEALAAEGLSPETSIVHHSVIDSHVERYLEAGLLPENAKQEIQVKQGSPHEVEVVGRPEKKVIHKGGTWGRSRKGWEKTTWVKRQSDLYVKELKARAKILTTEMNRLKVQERKLEHILSLDPMDKRNNLYEEMRKQIKLIFTKRNVAARKHNESLVDETAGVDDGSKDMYAGRKSAFYWRSSEFSNHSLSLMLYGGGRETHGGLGALKRTGIVGAIDRVMNQMLLFGEFSTKDDVKSAFQEVALFSKQGGNRSRRYVDMLTQNSVIKYGKGMGDMTVGSAFDAAYIALKGEDRARAERFHPLIRKFVNNEKYTTRVHLVQIDSAVAGPAFYDQINDQIVIDPTQIESDSEMFDVLTEEFAHSILSEVKFDKAAMKRINILMDAAKAELEKRPDHPLSNNKYFLSNVDEFLAHAFVDPDVAEFLNSVDLGDEALANKGMFDIILDIIKEALGLTAKEGTVLEEVLLHVHQSTVVRKEGRRARPAGRLTHGFGDSLQIPLRQFKNDLLYTRNLIMAEGSGFALDPDTMVDGTHKVNMGRTRSGLLNEVRAIFTAAFHGTPFARDIEKLSTEFIGSGEGAMVYGWGLYFAEEKAIAGWYSEMNTRYATPQDNEKYAATFDGGTQDDWVNDYILDARAIIEEGEAGIFPEWSAYDNMVDELTKAYILQIIDNDPRGFTWKSFYTGLRSWAQFEAFKDSDQKAWEFPWDKKLPSNLGSIADTPTGIIRQAMKEMSDTLALDKQGVADWINKLETDIMKSAKGYIEREGLSDKGRGVGLAKGFKAGTPLPEKGKVYEVKLAPKDDEYLLWDETRAKQSDKVSKALDDIENQMGLLLPENLRSGGDIYEAIASELAKLSWRRGEPKKGEHELFQETSRLMLKHGIRGNKYLDGVSRRGKRKRQGFDYVIFDDSDVEIRASFARRKRQAGEGQTELQFGEEQQELPLGLETTPSEDKPLFPPAVEGDEQMALFSQRKEHKADLSDKERMVLDDIQRVYDVYEDRKPSASPLSEPAVNASWVKDRFHRELIGDTRADKIHGWDRNTFSRGEAQTILNSLNKRGYLETSIGSSVRGREAKLYNPATPPQEQLALFAQRKDEVELTQGEVETKVRQLKGQLFPDQIVTDEAALESVETHWNVATDEDAQSYNVPSGINKAHLGKAVQWTHDRVFVEKAYNMMVRLNPELGEIKIPQFDPLVIDHPMFAGVRAEGQPPTTTAIEMWEADIVVGALSNFPLADIKSFVKGDRVHSVVGRLVAPKSQYAGKPTPTIEEGAFQPEGTGEVSAKNVGKLVAGEDQMALFAERKEYKAGNISGAEVNDIIASKLEIPSREKTRLENAMTLSDKAYEGMVSESHVLDVETRLIFEGKVGATKPIVSMAKKHELQRGTAPMADLDIQELEFAMDGLIGTNKKTRELFDTFITNIRIKSRLEDQSRTVTRSKARIDKFYEKDAKGNYLHWTVDEHGNPEELNMLDSEFTKGKSRLELEMELFDIINYSKEVAPWKNIEEARPDLQRGMEDLAKKLDDPEMLTVNEFGIPEGKFVEAAERFGQAMEESLFRQFKAGVIKWDHFHRLNSNSGLYFPFYVIKYFSRNPEDTFGKVIKGIRDIGETILKPMEAAKLSLYYSRTRSEHNVFMQELDHFRKEHDPQGNFISRVTDPEAEGVAGKDTVMFYEDGHKKYLLVDGRIAELLKNFDPVSASQTSLAMKLAGDFFKMGATGVNIFFQTFNFGMFDPLRLLTTSKAGLRMRDKGLNPFVLAQQYIRAIMASSWANLAPNSIRNLVKARRPDLTEGWDNLYREFVDSGAAGSTIAEYFHKPTSVKDTLTGSDKARRNPFTAVNAKASLLGKTLEQVSKIVGFQRMKVFEGIEELKIKIDKTKDAGTKMKLQRDLKQKLDLAASEVRNYAGSPDFLRQGSITRAEALNLVFIFFNARVQGVERDLNRLSKVFSKDSQERGEALGVGMKISAFAVVPTLWAWSMNRRDSDREDDYDEVSENDKKHYFHIPLDEKFEHPYIEGKMVADYIRIPRRETFGLFSYTIEKALDWMYDKDPNAVNEMISYWLEGSLPVSTEGLTDGDLVKAGESVMSNFNPLMKAIPEVLTNRNFYRHKPIVPLSMAGADASEQYFESTPEIYKDIGNLSGLGALRVKHLTEGLTAGMFTQLAPAKNVGIDGGIGRTVASTPLFHRMARSTYLDESELDEIMSDEKKGDATGRVLRRRKVNKFMEETRGMSIQDRVRNMKSPQNQNEHLVNQAIIRRLREQVLGLEPDELRLKNSSSNVRASVIVRKLQGKSPAQVKVYLTDLARKKILTPDVGLYIREKLRDRGETLLDYISEPVR